MYCPSCSQQQVSDEMRFCSRCGFLLSGVRELITSGGVITAGEAGAQKEQLPKSQRGMRKGVWIMLAAIPLAIVAGSLAAIDDVFAVLLLLPFLCFIIGIARLLYGTFLEKNLPQGKRDATQLQVTSEMPAQIGVGRSPELSPARGVPIEGFIEQRMKTAEMVQPQSVTENTTRLLAEDADSGHG